MVQLKLVNVLFWDVYCLQVFQFQIVIGGCRKMKIEEIDNCDFSEYSSLSDISFPNSI